MQSSQKHLAQPDLGAILQYQNNAVVERVARDLELSPLEAEALFQETKRFLYLAAASETRLAPPPAIDDCWHLFLIFTEDYADFCSRYFGRFLHHRPRRPEDPKGDGQPVSMTLSMAKQEFGTLGSPYWNLGPNEASDCSPSTNCESPPSDCALYAPSPREEQMREARSNQI